MFNSLSEKLESAFKNIKGEGRITELNIANTVKDIRRALVDADVNYKIAKEFKRLGFKFLGSTTLYAHMQATGMVNDHLITCFRHQACCLAK